MCLVAPLIPHAGIQSDLDLLLQEFSHKYSNLLDVHNEKECPTSQAIAGSIHQRMRHKNNIPTNQKWD